MLIITDTDIPISNQDYVPCGQAVVRPPGARRVAGSIPVIDEFFLLL